MRTHLAAYGPATIHDIAAWSGLSIRELRNTVTALDDQIITRRGPEETHLVDLADSPANATTGHAPVALLPWRDAVLPASAVVGEGNAEHVGEFFEGGGCAQRPVQSRAATSR